MKSGLMQHLSCLGHQTKRFPLPITMISPAFKSVLMISGMYKKTLLLMEAINKGVVSSPWAHWVQYGQMQRRFAKFNLPFEVLNDRNLNNDLYILLIKTKLYALNTESKNYLSTRTAIDFENFDIDFPTSYIFVSNPRDQNDCLKNGPT